MPCSAAHDPGVHIASRAERAGCMVAVLVGDLDIASAPALREEFLGLLRPGACRLIIDLSAAGFADASGAAVLVGTGRRARLLGGWLRLVSPSPGLLRVLSATGLDRHFATFATADEAINGVPGARAPMRPVPAAITRAQPAAGSGELRAAVGALLAHADAWRDADPRRRLTPALHVLMAAHDGTSNATLSQAAHSLLSVLGQEPVTPSSEVAATASRLRHLLYPDSRPAAC